MRVLAVIGLICGTFLIYTGKVSFQELKEFRKRRDLGVVKRSYIGACENFLS